MAESKKGLFSRLANRLSGAFKGKTNAQTTQPERSTRITLPGEEKSVSSRPVIVSESLFTERSVQTTPTKEPKTIYVPKTEPAEQKPWVPGKRTLLPKKTVVAPKTTPKKRKRKRYPDEKRLKKVFKTGQYLSKVRQRKHAIQKAMKAKTTTKKLKVKIRKTRLSKNAVSMLEKEMQETSLNQPLQVSEETESHESEWPSITIREENEPVTDTEKEKPEKNPFEKKERNALQEEPAPSIPTPPEPSSAAEQPPGILFPPHELDELPGTQRVARNQSQTGKKNGKETELEDEIMNEISKQHGKQPGKERKPGGKTVSATEKRKTGKKETLPETESETGEPKNDAEELKQLVAERFEGRIAPEQLQELQQKIRELLEQKMVTRCQMEENIRNADSERLLEGFTKLLSMIDIQGTRMEEPKTEMPSTIGPQQKPEKYAGTEKELEKKELVTDFDKILEIVRERGAVTLNELASELGMDKRLLKEAVDILEENNLIIQEFPAFGSARIIDPAYVEKKKEKE
jgi:hypothetical protein